MFSNILLLSAAALTAINAASLPGASFGPHGTPSVNVSIPGASFSSNVTAGDLIELNDKRGIDSGTAGEFLADKTIKLWDRICLAHGGNYGSCTIGNDNYAEHKGGCWKGYCWSGCFGACPCLRKQVKEWCWTGGRGWQYKSCKQDSDCDKNLPCAGSCTI